MLLLLLLHVDRVRCEFVSRVARPTAHKCVRAEVGHPVRGRNAIGHNSAAMEDEDMTAFLLGTAPKQEPRELPPCLVPLFTPPAPATLWGTAAARMYIEAADWPLYVVQVVCVTEHDWRCTIDAVLAGGTLRTACVNRACTRIKLDVLLPGMDSVTRYRVTLHESPAAFAAAEASTSANRLCMDIRTGAFNNTAIFSVNPIEVRSSEDAPRVIESWQRRGFHWFVVLPPTAADRRSDDDEPAVDLVAATDVPHLLHRNTWLHADGNLHHACARMPLLALAVDSQRAYNRLLVRVVRAIMHGRSPF